MALLDMKETAWRKLQNVLGVRGEASRIFMALAFWRLQAEGYPRVDEVAYHGMRISYSCRAEYTTTWSGSLYAAVSISKGDPVSDPVFIRKPAS